MPIFQQSGPVWTVFRCVPRRFLATIAHICPGRMAAWVSMELVTPAGGVLHCVARVRCLRVVAHVHSVASPGFASSRWNMEIDRDEERQVD